MNLNDTITIFVTMFVLSIVPGPSIFLVIGRSMTSSLGRGLFTILGIVLANFIFILLAVFGVGALVASMDGLFMMLKYAGSGYLFWLGIKLLFAKAKETTFDDLENASWSSNFAAGFVITISAPRAILFYVSLLPNFIDLNKIQVFDILLLMLVAAFAVGGAKLPYALLAYKSSLFLRKGKTREIMSAIAGLVMITTALVVALKP